MKKSIIKNCLFLAFAPLVAVISCNQVEPVSTEKSLVGKYKFVFQSPTDEIPTLFSIDSDTSASFINGSDQNQVAYLINTADSITFKMQVYESYFTLYKNKDNDTLKGFWLNAENLPYKVPVYALRAEDKFDDKEDASALTNQYNAVFTNIRNRSYNATAVFSIKENNQVEGTFAAEFGDFRAQSGVVQNNQLKLTSFDGIRALYFKADIKNDSLVKGTLTNQKGIDATFVAEKSTESKLKGADEIASYKEGRSFKANVFNFDNQPVDFVPTGKLNIIQISGTWCPNCHDESQFLISLHNKYAELGLEIYAVFFELSDDMSLVNKRVKNYKEKYGITYQSFFGRKPNKEQVEKTFEGLQDFYAYPTTIFVNDKNEVLKVYSGFYGKNTGQLHIKHIEEIEAFVKKSLE